MAEKETGNVVLSFYLLQLLLNLQKESFFAAQKPSSTEIGKTQPAPKRVSVFA